MDAFLAHKDIYPVLGMLVAGVSVASIFMAHYWYKLRRAEMELSLKQSMIDRGMTAAEICAVIASGESQKTAAEDQFASQASCEVKVKV